MSNFSCQHEADPSAECAIRATQSSHMSSILRPTKKLPRKVARRVSQVQYPNSSAAARQEKSKKRYCWELSSQFDSLSSRLSMQHRRALLLKQAWLSPQPTRDVESVLQVYWPQSWHENPSNLPRQCALPGSSRRACVHSQNPVHRSSMHIRVLLRKKRSAVRNACSTLDTHSSNSWNLGLDAYVFDTPRQPLVLLRVAPELSKARRTSGQSSLQPAGECGLLDDAHQASGSFLRHS